jgi:hypothetical protein
VLTILLALDNQPGSRAAAGDASSPVSSTGGVMLALSLRLGVLA